MKKNIITSGLACLLSLSIAASAQTTHPSDSIGSIDAGVTYVDPLFEYPMAPDNIEGFRDKCNWLVDNFWNPLDISPKGAIDQGKLNHAFKVYSTACQYADKIKVSAAVEKLYKKIAKNPGLLFQMTKAAEDNIYNPNAEYLIDELYVDILRNALKQKKFPAGRKARYESQLKRLENSMEGSRAAVFDFKRPNGNPAKYFPMSTPTLLFFGDPECDDCRLAKLRLQSNVAFSKAVTDGKINVVYIIPDPDEGWEAKVADYPEVWAVGASDSVAEILDLRFSPDIYVVDGDGNIAGKHIGLNQAMNILQGLIQPKQQSN